VWFSYVTGAMMIIPVLALALIPLVNGDITSHALGGNFIEASVNFYDVTDTTSTFNEVAMAIVWFWVIAYILFPLAAAWLAWGAPPPAPPSRGLIAPRWIPVFLRVQGALLVALAAACFTAPKWVAAIWPWKISTFLAQVYSGPLLAYGVGSLVLAARRNWEETLIPAIGFLVFSGLAVIGSCRHLALFAAGSPSEIAWFAALGSVLLGSAVLVVGAARGGAR